MSKPHPSSSLAGLFNAWRRDFWWSIASTRNPSHRRRLVAFTFILVLVIGVADYLTGFELSLLVFYLLPICLAVASVGWRFGVVTSVLSIATWLIGDFAAGAHFLLGCETSIKKSYPLSRFDWVRPMDIGMIVSRLSLTSRRFHFCS